MEVNGEGLEEQGNKITVEHENNDILELIWKQIDIVLGQKFWDIQPDEKISRYRIENSNVLENQYQSIENESIEIKIAFEEKNQTPQTFKPNISHQNNDGDKIALVSMFLFAIILAVGLIYVIYNVIMLQ